MKEKLYDGSTLAMKVIDNAIEEYLVLKGFKWEWKSVIGEDCDGKSIWSLHIYVEEGGN